ncbi:hypothetical protein SCHIN_v1c08200 [Spiroplasma chinense]|uniref:Endonuclease Z1 domain-containing protein n=1 Tax=Spiroplasma chinense TaxID=216932 RepID=A0A5B9Y5B7_9MOLU|nr:Z1 domain-containing protein [Spiroplasma chinense]QEH62015.1 hypothetical protein SCHIN_v1c08200 [Spiroplasma chinense]
MFRNRFIEIYTPEIGAAAVNEILSKSKKILQDTLEDGKPNCKTGIIVGKVQSGKTSNFLGLIAEAFDSDMYDIVFLIGGVDNELLSQNKDRVSEVYSDVKNNKRRISGIFSSDEFGADRKADWVESNRRFLSSSKDKKSIITVLKNINHLSNLESILTYYKDIFKDKRILIIDDEGDQGTLDGNANTNKEPRTKWNQKISDIKDQIEQFSYLSVTATPYANMLIQQNDELSPKFVRTTKPGKGYCGLETFHGEDSDKYLVEIPEHELENLYSLDEKQFKNKDINPSLEKALSYFLCASLSLINEESKNKYFEMLINTDRETGYHDEFKEKIRIYLDKIVEIAEELEEDPNSIMKKTYHEFINLGFEMINNRKLDESNPKDCAFIEDFLGIIEDTRAFSINSKGDRFGENKQQRFRIYIGSNLLGRGITLKNLLVTYMTRTAKSKNQADTILQRARWFGYRGKTLKYMKIFIIERLIKEFFDISVLENDLWEKLDRIETGELSVEGFMNSIFFSLDDETLKITRPNVANYKPVGIFSWLNQNMVHPTKEIERMFYKNVEEQSKNIELGGRRFEYKDYESLTEFTKESNISSYIFKKINLESRYEIAEANFKEFPVRVILMKPQNRDKPFRSVSEKQRFTIHASGANKDVDYNDETQYFGDSKIDYYSENKNKVIIQVYNFNYKREGEIIEEDAIAYSVFFPNYKVKGITRG